MSINFSIKGIDKFSKVFGKLKKSLIAVNKTTEKSLTKSNLAIAKLKRNISSLNQTRLGHLQQGLAGIAALRGSLTFINPAMEFEKTMDLVRSKMPELQGSLKDLKGEAKKDFEEMKNVAGELGATTVKSASEIAEGMSFLAQAGFNAKQISKSIEGVTMLSIAGGVGMKEAADISSDIGTAFFGKDVANQMGRMTDVMAKAAAATNTDILQIGEGMKFAAPVAKAFNLSIEETSAMMGVLANSGIKGSLAGTGMRRMLLALNAPTSKANKLMKDLGISTEEVSNMRGKFNKLGVKTKDESGKLRPMIDVLKDMAVEIHKLPETKRGAILNDIFGKQGITSAMVLFDSLRDGVLQDLTKDLNNADGAALKMAITMSDNTDGAFKAFGSVMEALRIQIGDLFLEDIKNAMKELIGFVGGIKDWVKNNKELTKTIFGIVVGFGGLLTAGAAVGIMSTTLAIAGSGLLVNYHRMVKVLKWVRGSLLLKKAAMVKDIAITGISKGSKLAWAGAMGVAKIATWAFTGALNLAGGGMRLLKIALISSGVGAIAVGIGMAAAYIIQNWGKIAPVIQRLVGKVRIYLSSLFEPIRQLKDAFNDSVVGKIAGKINNFSLTGSIKNVFGMGKIDTRGSVDVKVSIGNAPRGSGVSTTTSGSVGDASTGMVFAP